MLPIPEQEYLNAREAAWKRLSTNPRWMVGIPSEQTCRRCHNGKIHYKTQIFVADCRDGKNYENCLKCHPLMTKEYFEQYRKEREKVEAASNGAAGSMALVSHSPESRAQSINPGPGRP